MFGLAPRTLEWLGAGTLLTLIGVFIKFAGWTWLLAGYDKPTSEVPDDVVRDVAGNTVLRIGIALLLIGILGSVTTLPAYLDLVVGAAILLAVARLLYRLNTWSPSETT